MAHDRPGGDLEGDPLLPYCLLEKHLDPLGGTDAELREELRSVVPPSASPCVR